MEFEWDESKRISNLRKHGIDFLDVAAVFGRSIVTISDDRFDYGEERFVTFGLLRVLLLLSIQKVKTASELFLQGRQANMSKKSISSKSETDWKKLDAMTDEDIDFSDCPEITPQQFAKSVVRRGLPVENNKVEVTLRLDSDVLEWFSSQGKSYQTKINSLLRAYMETHN